MEQQKLYKIAYFLAVFTILYNLAEGIVSVWLGYSDETLALFGFGVDSFIEMMSGAGILVMVIRIGQNTEDKKGHFEKAALRTTGYSFYILCVGLVAGAVISIYTRHAPLSTFWGTIISLISIVVMIGLIISKLKVGRALNSDPMIADARCTLVCIYMSVVLLVSSLIFEFTGFKYIDALGALGLAWFSFVEGREAFEKAISKDCLCEHCKV